MDKSDYYIPLFDVNVTHLWICYSFMDKSDYYIPQFDVNVLNMLNKIHIILFYSVDCPLSIVVSFIIFFMILSSNALFLSVPIPPNADCEYLKKFS